MVAASIRARSARDGAQRSRIDEERCAPPCGGAMGDQTAVVLAPTPPTKRPERDSTADRQCRRMRRAQWLDRIGTTVASRMNVIARSAIGLESSQARIRLMRMPSVRLHARLRMSTEAGGARSPSGRTPRAEDRSVFVLCATEEDRAPDGPSPASTASSSRNSRRHASRAARELFSK